MQKEFLQAREAAKTNRDQMFQNRGISLDSNLWPDYDLDLSLQTLMKQGMLKPGSIRRVAIVGPGLDFVNKQQGVDYYPPQTTQPFAVLDSLLRLGLAKPDGLELYTFDISSRVNLHIEAARKNAALGRRVHSAAPVVLRGALERRLPREVYAVLAELGSADRTAGCRDSGAARALPALPRGR